VKLSLEFAASLPKSDAPEGETGDDRFFVSRTDSYTWRVAVSDGASDCFLPGVWAAELTRSFTRFEGEGVPPLDNALREWRRAAYAEQLPWYAEAKRQQGAAATLLGVALHPGGTWEAVAVGDSCLFQVREDIMLASFPMANAGEFHSMPALFRTLPTPPPTPRTARGEWQSGDRFFLMTDALAAWFLHEVESGRAPWNWLTGFGILGTLGAEQAFGSRIVELRRAGRLRDDDVTLLHFHARKAETHNADLVADTD
jgi:hypothetical protein